MHDTDTLEICREMEQVRESLGDDVEEIVDSARTLTDWRHYVRRYPLACVAGAAVVGFLMVPKRVEIVSPTADQLEELARRNKLVVKPNPKPQDKSGIGAAALNLVANAALRAVVSYLGQNMGKIVGNTAAESNGANDDG